MLFLPWGSFPALVSSVGSPREIELEPATEGRVIVTPRRDCGGKEKGKHLLGEMFCLKVSLVFPCFFFPVVKSILGVLMFSPCLSFEVAKVVSGFIPWARL